MSGVDRVSCLPIGRKDNRFANANKRPIFHVGAVVAVHWGQSEYAGRARVVGIAPCPPIAQGDGYVVTATIRRIAKSHLKIDFGEESIGVNEEHPFWSEDRNGWVSARRLKVNEVVRSTGNKQVSVESITHQKQASVYNLEVNRSHSYLVGKSRLVVHNGCGEQKQGRKFKRIASKTIRGRWEKSTELSWPRDENGRNFDVAHILALADGGSNELRNIMPMEHAEHMADHVANGDFSRWAKEAADRRRKKKCPKTK